MIGQFLDKLDDTLYKDWHHQADALCICLNEAFDNIQFDSTKHPDLAKIKASLDAININKQLSRQAYVQHIKDIKEQLDKYAIHKDYDNVALNHFIFQAHRSFGWLMMLLFTDYNKYAKAALNPSNKVQPTPQSDLIKDFAIKLGANYAVDNLHELFYQQVGQYMQLQAEDIKRQPKIQIKEVIDYSKITKPVSLLEQILGALKYAELDSQLLIQKPEDISRYLSEQIYGLMFKSMYSSIASMEETLDKINKLAESGKSTQEIEELRQRLLNDAQLSEIDQPEARAYRNRVAVLMGFKDAKDLYDNFKKLGTQDGFLHFKDNLKQFTSYANQAILVDLDPLENMKKEISNENERVKRKMSKAHYAQHNLNYINQCMYRATNLIFTLNGAQIARNIAQHVAQDFLDPKRLVGDNPGIMMQMAIQAADLVANRFNYKKYFEICGLSRLQEDLSSLESRYLDANRAINEQWLEKWVNQIDEHHKQREALIAKAQKSDFETDPFMVEYVENMVLYKDALLGFHEVKTLSEHNAKFILKNKQYNDVKLKHKHFTEAFTIGSRTYLNEKSVAELDAIIDKKEAAIRVLSDSYATHVSKVSSLNVEINQETRRLTTTIGGAFQRFGEKIAGFFKIKTKAVKEREARHQAIKVENRKMDVIGIQLNTEMEILNYAKEQKAFIQSLNEQSILELKKSIIDLTSEYNQSYQQLYTNVMQSTSMNTSFDLFAAQQQHAALKNKLIKSIQTLNMKMIDKGIDIPLAELEIFLSKCKEAQLLIAQYNAHIVGEDKNKANRLTSEMQLLIDQLAKQLDIKYKHAQQEYLQNCKSKVVALFAQNQMENIADPYLLVSMDPEIPQEMLTQENRRLFNQFIRDEFITFLNKATNARQQYKQLEQLFKQLRLGYHRVNNKADPDDNDVSLKEHYQYLSNVVSSQLEALSKSHSDLTFNEQKNELYDLDTTFVEYLKQYESQAKQFAIDESSYNSIFFNPFGWRYSIDFINQQKSALAASSDHIDVVSKYYIDSLQRFLEKSGSYWAALDHDELLGHINHFRHHLVLLKNYQSPQLEKIIDLHTQILNIATEKEQEHVYHLINKVTTNQLDEIEDNLKSLKALRASLRKTMISNHDIDISEYEAFHSKLNALFAQLDEYKIQLSQIEMVRQSLSHQYQELGKNQDSSLEILKSAASRVAVVSFDMEQLKKADQLELSLYADIVKGNDIIIPNEIDRKVLGNFLIMAIRAKNKAVIDSVINHTNRIDLQDMLLSLKQAAALNDLETVKKLFVLNPPLHSDDFFECIQSALNNHSSEVAIFLILNAEFTPNPSQIDFLKNHTLESDSAYQIDKGWLQLLVDKDGASILPDLRKWYLFQQQLLESIQQKLADLQLTFDQKDHPGREDLSSELSVLLKQLERVSNLELQSQDFLKYKTGREFKSALPKGTDRVYDHYKKWSDELNANILSIKQRCIALEQQKEVVASSSNDLLPFKRAQQALDTLVESSEFLHSKDFSLLDQALNDLRFTVSEDLADSYSHSLLRALIHVINSNKYKAIPTILAAINKKEKADYLRYALTQAMNSGNIQAFSILLQENSAYGNDITLFDDLWKIYEEAEQGKGELKHRHIPEIALLFLMEVSVPLHNGQIDPRVEQLLNLFLKSNQQSLVAPVVAKGWYGYFDNDFAKLQQLRNAFVIAESAYDKIATNIHRLLQKQFDKLIQLKGGLLNISEVDINRFEYFTKHCEAILSKQILMIEKCVGWYEIKYANQLFDNPVRKDAYLKKWSAAQAQQINKLIADMTKEIAYMQGKIKEYHEAKAVASTTSERRSGYLTMSQNRSDSLGTHASATPDDETSHRPILKK